MFTVVNGALLKPLPFAQPERLVILAHWPAELPGNSRSGLSDHTFAELRATPSRAFAAVASFLGNQVTLTGSGDAERLSTGLISANLTSTLGVSAAIGRTFTAAEEEPGSDHVVILSDPFWRERFGGARSVLGVDHPG
jgi:hypothetical protein